MNKDQWKHIKHFQPHEFFSPDIEAEEMNAAFVAELDRIRHVLGQPMTVTSGYRTEAHNKAVGGVKDSAHMKGLAVDIAVPDGQYRYMLVTTCLARGIVRIGVGKDFVHIDMDKSKNYPRMWVY